MKGPCSNKVKLRASIKNQLLTSSPTINQHDYVAPYNTNQCGVRQQGVFRSNIALKSSLLENQQVSDIEDTLAAPPTPIGFNGKEAWLSRGILLLCAALYGTNFASVKMLDESLAPSLAAMFRFSLAGLVFAPSLFKNGFKNKSITFGGMEVGLYVFLGYLTQAIALETTPASIAAFICSLSVIVVPMLDMVKESFTPSALKNMTPITPESVDDETIMSSVESTSGATTSVFYPMEPLVPIKQAPKTIQQKFADVFADKRFSALWPAMIATAGVACLELGGSRGLGPGDLWALGQPLLFGLGFWRAEHHMKKLTSDDGQAEAFTGSLLATVALCSFFWSVQDWAIPHMPGGINMQSLSAISNELHKLLPVLTTPAVLLNIVWTGVVTTALTTYGENFSMKYLSSAETTVIFSTEPLFGTAFAALTLGEYVGPNTFLGALLILTACLWSSLPPNLVSIPALLTSAQAALLGDEEATELGNVGNMILKNIEQLAKGAAESGVDLDALPPPDLPM